jgi:prepilin peptidase CpaA
VESYFMLGALIAAVIGAGSDVRARRIPNWLTYGSLVTGIALRTILGSWHGLGQAVGGALVGGGVFFVLFIAGGMGAGDVKLMAAVSAWAGLKESGSLLLATALAGGVLAVVYMVFYRRVGSTVMNAGELLRFHVTAGIKPHPELSLQSQGALRMPYGVAIAAGTLYLFLSTATFWRG